MVRLYAGHLVGKVASLASPGVDESRRVRPVRPGHRLSIRTTIQGVRVSRSKPDRGIACTPPSRCSPNVVKPCSP
jgi:acyl dehydratase